MNVTINLPPGAEQKLREAAARRGETLEAYLEWLAIQSAGNGARPAANRTPEFDEVARLGAEIRRADRADGDVYNCAKCFY